MEHELNYERPEFQKELSALMKSAQVVRIYGWGRAQNESSILDLIEEHGYRVEVYTILNYARLLPKSG